MDAPDLASQPPLAGVRVLDLTRVVMGPLATQILADQGADVIMVEAKEGDTNRVMGPGPHSQLSGISLNLLRNKRSVVLDLKSPESRHALEELVRQCDVVVSTMRPHVLTRLGLDYATVRALREDVIYCQAQGFAVGSPRANEPAYDDIIQAASGVSDVVERVTGAPGLMPTIFADKVCGIVMAQAVTAALVQRARTGQGRHVEVPMNQAISAFMLVEHGAGAISDPPVNIPGRPAAGYARVLSPDRRPHPTSDGWVHILPYRPEHYASLFREAGLAGAADDLRYADQRATIANSDSLYRDVRSITPMKTTEAWLEYCRQAGIPATNVSSIQDLVDELPLLEHPHAGPYRIIPPMVRFHGLPVTAPTPAPLIGENTAAVLEELGALKTEAP
ncbi:E-cinnamoyl-CoA:R-phenyllactate CoA transferase [Rhodococcus erythropolis]|uniref:CaiB/BaiF CoA transferase family protein n=1 Tax=Rhodococcus erythropolis TaxID=1833 RepID=UPI0015574C87|nr:CoA transferase [Rhodococcus erythropolis]PBI89435.1 E-cinnamoyl-CoA:R-phenyllactate CoA transferase [Rhodococcus erythropolis]